jgi:hypothetical protein
MPKGGMPKGAQDSGSSKTPAEIAAEEQRALTVPCSGRDVSGRSGTAWPVLTRTNYNSWSLLMKVILQVRHL